MTVSRQTIGSAAERLRRAAETGVAMPPLRDEAAAGGVQAAYAVQQANTAAEALAPNAWVEVEISALGRAGFTITG
jgi:2-keto-4-pentenoate hydratase